MEKGMYFLDQKDMPTHWYNIMADMPGDMPPLLHPGTGTSTWLPMRNTCRVNLKITPILRKK